MPRIAKGTLALVLSALSTAVPAQTTVAGFTPGSFRVTESGAAEYRIPIRVPPGIAGIEPTLALVYNSQSGNGLLGVGWNLEGLSAITRCPRTLAQDGVRGGVNYDANDRFCMDGQRLMAVSGTYGADGTEYRTERESFTKVISYGTAGNGPAWFKAWTKSGQIIEYGNSTDSRIEAQGKSTVRVWAQNKLSDTKGNYLTVSYTEDGANGAFYPSSVSYSLGTSVQFTTEARPDHSLSYQGGSVIRHTARLLSIKPYAGTTPVLEYRIGYAQGSITQDSTIDSIRECSGDGSMCKPTTLLGWNPGGTGQFEPAPTYGGSAGDGLSYLGSDPERQKFADVNGDGKADLVHVNGAGGLIIHLNNGQGGFNTSASFNGLGTVGSEPGRQKLVDVNGDGCADLIYINGGLLVFLSECQGSIASYPSFGGSAGDGLTYLGPDPSRYKFADVNGDALIDLVAINGSGGAIVHLNNGQGGFQTTPSFGGPGPGQGLSYLGSDPLRQNFVDVNGDACADWVHVNGDGGAIVHLSACTGTFAETPSFGGPGPGQGLSYLGPDPTRQIFVDVNSDGCSDWIHVNGSGGLIVHLADCAGGFVATPTFGGPGPGNGLPNIGNEPQRQKFADVNGDGFIDLIHINGAGGAIVFLNNSVGGFAETPSFGGYGPGQGLSYLGSEPARQFFVDVRGWGRADWIHVSGAGGVIVHSAAGYYFADALVSINSGLGKQVDIAFKPTSDPTVYANDPVSPYPILSLQAPRHVCSHSTISNGIAGTFLYSYLFGGAKADLLGRGLLGFRWYEQLDHQSNIKVRTESRQDWPYAGMPSVVKSTQSSGAVLSEVTNTYSCTDPATGGTCTVGVGQRYFPYVSQSVQTGNDLNGAALPTVTTTSSYDVFGNATSVVLSTGDGYSKTTTNTYTNDPTNWLLGRLTRSTVQSTVP